MKYFTLTAILVVTFFANAQDNFKFGKVSKEEVAQIEHHLEKDTEAAILYKKERVFYDYNAQEGFRTMRDAHYRIKIYSKSGLDWGTLEVPLYTSDSSEEQISSIKGITYNLVNGKVIESKLKKSSVFKENVNKYRNKATIAMPEVKEGSVVEISYRIASDFAGNLDDFQLQYGIPVNKVDISVEIPEYYIFKRHGRGFYPISINQTKKNRKMTVQYRDEGDIGRMNGGNRTSNLEFFENVYKINTANIPSLKEEDYTDNIDNYRSSIKFELASTQFPSSPYKNYSLSWEDVAESIYKFDGFGGELKKTRFVEDVVDGIKSNSSDQNQLLHNIYDFVKTNINWNEYNGVLCENGIKKTLEEKKGNAADINLLLTVMLRYAGFKADPVLVSTKSHGVPLFPTREGFNYVVTSVNTGSENLLLDATEKMGTLGVLPTRVLNWEGRLIQKDGSSKTVDLTPKKRAKKITFATVALNPDGSASGKLRSQLTDNKALAFRSLHKDHSLEEIMDELEDSYTTMEIDGLDIQNQKDCQKPIVEVYEFNKEAQVEAIADKLYFRPTLFMGLTENPFKMEKREYPIDFIYPQSEKATINITVPEGYVVESLPESTALGLPDKLGSFKYSLRQQGNLIQVNCATDLNLDLVPSVYYESIKEFYNQIVNKLNERVVLIKA